MTTALMTRHARERCAEMKISTKIAKKIVANAEVRYPGRPSDAGPSMVALWSGEQRYAVVYSDEPDGPVVLTVLFRCQDYYERDGDTYIRQPA